MDRYCYPGTSILKNKKGIKDAGQLFWAEATYTWQRLQDLEEKPIRGGFDFRHLKKIHRYIFQDLYEWAGHPRTVNISKGNMFCSVQNIESYAGIVFRNFAGNLRACKDDPEAFIHALAENYGNLNALHPFWEGNGRSQREFARELCLDCGYIFDISCSSHEEMLSASIQSFTGSSQGLEEIFKRAVMPQLSSK